MGKYSTKKLFIIAAVVYLIAAIFSVGNHHPDEHFQIFEFAAIKLGLAYKTDLAWEYHFMMRPTIQSAMVVVAHRFLGVFGLDNPAFVAFVFRLLSAVLSLFAIKLLVELYQNRFKHDLTKYWYVILSLFLWISVYNNVRFSSENWSGTLFVIGFAWMLKRPHPKVWTYLGVGALFGLSFVIRYQAAFMVLGFGLWLLFFRKDAFKDLVIMALAFFALVGIGSLIDRWFYGEWVITTWNYLKFNILENRVSGFGVSPWYFYITRILLDLIPPFSLIYVAPMLWMIYKKSKSALVWTIVPFLVIHFLIGHKETRFMFPIIGFVPVAAAYFIDGLLSQKGADLFEKVKGWYWFKKLFWIVNVVLLLFISLSPSNEDVKLAETFYSAVKGPSILYYDHSSPIGDGLPYKYYRPPNLDELPIDVVDTVSPITGKQVFVAVGSLELYGQYKTQGKLIFRSYPEWLRYFNINGWIDRTSWWYIIEIEQ